MLIWYVVCSVVGLALILLSAFSGHQDLGGDGDVQLDSDAGGVDVDHDLGVDHSDLTGHAAEAGAWLPFLSLRFWTYLCAGFGATGLLLSFFTRTSSGTVFVLSVVTGLVCGLMVAYVYRALQVSNTDSMTREKDVLGCHAKVLVAIRKDQPGRVRCCVKGDWVDFVALSNDGSELQAGEDAVIVALENGKAMVIPKSAIFD